MLRDHHNESHLQCSGFVMHDPWGVAPGLSMSCTVGAREVRSRLIAASQYGAHLDAKHVPALALRNRHFFRVPFMFLFRLTEAPTSMGEPILRQPGTRQRQACGALFVPCR